MFLFCYSIPMARVKITKSCFQLPFFVISFRWKRRNINIYINNVTPNYNLHYVLKFCHAYQMNFEHYLRSRMHSRWNFWFCYLLIIFNQTLKKNWKLITEKELVTQMKCGKVFLRYQHTLKTCDSTNRLTLRRFLDKFHLKFASKILIFFNRKY